MKKKLLIGGGAVFRGDRVRWDAFGDGICRVPADTLGAPQAGGH